MPALGAPAQVKPPSFGGLALGAAAPAGRHGWVDSWQGVHAGSHPGRRRRLTGMLGTTVGLSPSRPATGPHGRRMTPGSGGVRWPCLLPPPGCRTDAACTPSDSFLTLYTLALLVARTGAAVAHLRLGPTSSATTSTTDRALPSSAVQVRCWSRPTTTTRLPLLSDCAACSAWLRHTTTVKNDASCSLRALTATRNMARAIPPSVCRSSGSSVRLPA